MSPIEIPRDVFELIKGDPEKKEELRSEIRSGVHVIVVDEDGLRWHIDADFRETQVE